MPVTSTTTTTTTTVRPLRPGGAPTPSKPGAGTKPGTPATNAAAGTATKAAGDRRAPAGPAKPTKPAAKAAEADCLAPVVPAPVAAATPADAVAAALKGDAVKLPLGADAEAPGLAIRELIPRGDQRAFEVGLARLRFEIVLPAASDADAALARLLPMIAQVPDPVRGAIRRVSIRPGDPATPTYVVDLAGDGGKLSALTIQKAPNDAKTVKYTVADANGGKFELVTAPDAEDAWEVAQAFSLWATIPPALRGALKTIAVDDGANPTDAYWAEQYKTPNFESAATGGNGAATFWHGKKYLKQDYFLHEFGHVLGQTYSTKNAMQPDGWEEAIAADAKGITNYGNNSPAEDFAEAFWVYLTLQQGGRVMVADPPQDLAGFAARWPKRAAILDAIFKGELRPVSR